MGRLFYGAMGAFSMRVSGGYPYVFLIDISPSSLYNNMKTIFFVKYI